MANKKLLNRMRAAVAAATGAAAARGAEKHSEKLALLDLTVRISSSASLGGRCDSNFARRHGSYRRLMALASFSATAGTQLLQPLLVQNSYQDAMSAGAF